MLRKTRKPTRARARTLAEAPGHVLTALVEVCFLASSFDRYLDEGRLAHIADSIEDFVDGAVSRDELLAAVREAEAALERDGYDARLCAILTALEDDGLRLLALRCAAVVLLSDDELIISQDGEMFVALAQSLGLSREVALDAIEEARDHYD